MIRFLIIRFILPLLVFLILRSVLKSIWGALNSSVPAEKPKQQAFSGGELKKDPVCGTYISAASAFTRTVDGKLLHFCSTGCRDKYRA